MKNLIITVPLSHHPFVTRKDSYYNSKNTRYLKSMTTRLENYYRDFDAR